jgi:hypothetical protein
MAKFLIGQVVKGQRDSGGVEIDTVYTKVDPVYAVFGTCERVVVQFADDDALGLEQRRALAPLNPVRGEINGLVDGWRSSNKDHDKSKARIFDRRVADALVVALQGDPASAGPLLAAIKADILAERTSIARRQYMIVAAAAVLVVLCVTSLLASSFTTMDYMFKTVWATAGFGALGAFFSSALAIRDRSIGTDLQRGDNIADATLRVLIGAISGAILYCLLRTDLIQLKLGNSYIPPIQRCTGPNGHVVCTPPSDIMEYFVILLAFIAGFSERMVGDLLNKATATVGAASNPLAGTTPPPSSPTPSAGANEQNPRGNAQAAPPAAARAQAAEASSADDAAEGCVSDHPVPESQQTSDVELPEATGGVETPAAAPAN